MYYMQVTMELAFGIFHSDLILHRQKEIRARIPNDRDILQILYFKKLRLCQSLKIPSRIRCASRWRTL